jgi:hypothetical protein
MCCCFTIFGCSLQETKRSYHWEQLKTAAWSDFSGWTIVPVKASQDATLHAGVPVGARKPTQAAAHEKLAWMRSTQYVITRLQLIAYIYTRVLSQVCCVTDLAHTSNAASRRK